MSVERIDADVRLILVPRRMAKVRRLRRPRAIDGAGTMFTGIVIATGRVASIREKGGDLELGIDAGALDLKRIAVGDSVSVKGVCLTAMRIEGQASMQTSRARRSRRPRSGRSRRDAASISSRACAQATRSGGTW